MFTLIQKFRIDKGAGETEMPVLSDRRDVIVITDEAHRSQYPPSRHFVGRGFTGKAMYVGVDKAAAVRMYDLVREAWAEHLAELRARHDALAELERPWLASRIELMETTDMAVVISQGQNEIKDLADKGLDIKPHRARMIADALDEDFKDPTHPLRLVFVCAMWMTGFDAPSVSTIYLDRPMRNHTLMQTIARANRVFPDKDNGLIVDYIGVFRDLERALAIYGAANADANVDSPIQGKSELVAALADAVAVVVEFCERYDVDVDELRLASGFTFIALRDSAVEALLADEEVRTEFLAAARHARKLFKAVLPDPAAADHQSTVAVTRCWPNGSSTWPGRSGRISTRSPMQSTICSTDRSGPRST